MRQRVWWTETMAEDLGTRELGMVRSQRLDEVSFVIFSFVPSTSMISVFILSNCPVTRRRKK